MMIMWSDIISGVAVLLIGAALIGAFKFVSTLSAGQQQITKVVADGFSKVEVSHAKMCGSLEKMCGSLDAHAELDDTRFEAVHERIDSVPCRTDT